MCLFWRKKGEPITGGIKEGMRVRKAQSCNTCKRSGKNCVKLNVGSGVDICLV
jgi:hypothetical protein